MTYQLESAETAASSRGLRVVEPLANELFIDIDTNADFEFFNEQLRHIKSLLPTGCLHIVSVNDWPSSSGLPHRHVRVRLSRDVSNVERIALQAVLGSDRKREMLSVVGLP